MAHCFAVQSVGQCPDRKLLWDRIIYLRTTNQLPVDEQIEELLKNKKKLDSCYVKYDSTHALLLQRLGALYFFKKDYNKAVLFTNESIKKIPLANRRSVESGLLVKNYFNLSIYYDALDLDPYKKRAYDSCVFVSINDNTSFELSIWTLYKKTEEFVCHRGLSKVLVLFRFGREY
jgi:hypothetical protein